MESIENRPFRSEQEVPVAYVTKYWEARGIWKVTGCTTDKDGYLMRNTGFCSSPSYLFIGKSDWFTDLEKAQEVVKARAEKKALGLQKKILDLKEIATKGVEVVPHDPKDE